MGKKKKKLPRVYRWKFFGGMGENKPSIMSNKDRRERGFPQDPNLPDYQNKE